MHEWRLGRLRSIGFVACSFCCPLSLLVLNNPIVCCSSILAFSFYSFGSWLISSGSSRWPRTFLIFMSILFSFLNEACSDFSTALLFSSFPSLCHLVPYSFVLYENLNRGSMKWRKHRSLIITTILIRVVVNGKNGFFFLSLSVLVEESFQSFHPDSMHDTGIMALSLCTLCIYMVPALFIYVQIPRRLMDWRPQSVVFLIYY